MLAALEDAEQEEAWGEIQRELSRSNTGSGFAARCGSLVAAGTAPQAEPAARRVSLPGRGRLP